MSAGGGVLSRPGIDTTSWYPARLPATVLGALIDAGRFPDPFFGTNLAEIPGQGPPGKNFSNHPMPPDSPFRVPWWFRKELAPSEVPTRHATLELDGINYRANLWLNGELIAAADQLAGAYRHHELDLTGRLRQDQPNVLAVEVLPPEPSDLALSWVDWNPAPPDKNMGLWRDVRLRSTGPVALRSPHVLSRLQRADGTAGASLTVVGDLVNLTPQLLTAVVRAQIEDRHVSKSFQIPPHTRVRATIDKEDHPGLALERARLWWPHTIGAPELYQISLEVEVDGRLSDSSRFAFGIREIIDDRTPDGHARFVVNGVPLLIRGGGWATDLFLRRQPDRDRAQLAYVKALGLNAIRFEGMLERDDFLDLCDKEGILVIGGWCCCDRWEKWDDWTAENHLVAAESLRSQIRRVRRHPSLLAWWYGSDRPPPPPVESRYLEILAQEDWPNPSHSSASHHPSSLTGSSGFKMLGPYDWVPPNYWLEDTERGGAFGFATEISPGPAVPPIESLKKMLPAGHLWPIDEVWAFHAGRQKFDNIKLFTEALEARYGKVDNVDQLAELSQLACYEAQRAMFEGYARNRGRATGVIQWMLNNAWPSLIWHLHDYYLRPGGGFFGTQKACQPLHVMCAPDDQSIVVINDHARTFSGLTVAMRVLDLQGSTLEAKTHRVTAPPLSSTAIARVAPPIPHDSGGRPYFVDLRLLGWRDLLLSRNFYWLPATLDLLDRPAATTTHTPVVRYADLSALRRLGETRLVLNAVRRDRAGAAGHVQVDIQNPGDRLAFFVQLRLADALGQDLLPVVWSDNYLSLLPGERRIVRAGILAGDLAALPLSVEARGLNVPVQSVPLGSGEGEV
jgi:exo-1,4-beta-D-glucosaminidase